METILQIRDVLYSYNGKPVLAIDELEISQGSITGLAGPNGSGKTTLLKLLSGVEKPTSGSVSFYGKDRMPDESPSRHKICLLPQQTYLLRRSVFENIAYGIKVRGQKEGVDRLVAEALELVGLPKFFSERKWHELSGGEAQRVALAARLALKPDCLLLDEPTASVDMESARSIRRAVLLARKEWGTTLIIASHYRSWLNDICDSIVYLYNGRVLDCSYENILTGPWESVDDELSACFLSDGQKVYVSKPPHADCSVVFSPETMKMNGPVQDTDMKSFQGIISSIALENHGAAPQVQVTCGDQRFVVSVSKEQLVSENSVPGQKVILSYNPKAVTWLEK